mgnify:CR=1 FL=1
MTFKSTLLAEKTKKFAKTSLNVKVLECKNLHLCALKEETYFIIHSINIGQRNMKLTDSLF